MIKLPIMKIIKNIFSEELTRSQMQNIRGGVQTNCGVKIDGEWYRLGLPDGEGAARAQEYVANGWATNWCCDSCPQWETEIIQ